ncbi:MAG: hypothetical protein WC074_05390 [bacterium]|jgi:hypothetical protein
MDGAVEAAPVASVPKPDVQAHTRPQTEAKVSTVGQTPVHPATGQAEGAGASVEGNNSVLGIQEMPPQEIQADPFRFQYKTDRARELQRVGHIDADKSNQIASEAAKLEDVFSQQLHYAGPVSDALNQAAREMAVGGNINEIREGLYKRVRETVRAVFAGTEAEYYPTDKGTEGTGSVAAGQAGLFDGGEGGQLTPPQEIKAQKRLESIGVSNADAAVAKIAGVDSLDKIGWPETDNLITAHDFLNVDRKAFLQKYGLKRVSKQSVEVHGETKKTPNDIDAFAGESTYKVGKKIGKSTKLLTDPALIYRQSVCQIQNQAQLFRWH